MKKDGINKKGDAINHKDDELPVIPYFFILIFFSIISYILFKLSKIYKIWILYIFAFFIFLFGFEIITFGLFNDYQKKNLSHPLFNLSKNSDLHFSLIISLVPILIFYFFTKSTIILITFIIFFIGGITGSGLRNAKSIFFILTIFSLITLFYAYEKKDIFWYIISTFILAYMFITIGEYLSRNVENRHLMMIPSYLLIISLSFALFFIHFFEIRILSLIGLLASTFFGFFFLELSLISYLKNILIFRKEDQYYVFNLIFMFLSLLLFSIFIFYKYNMYIYIGASLCLSFGVISLKLVLQKYFSDKISKDISFSIGFGILGVTITIFYFLFMKVSIIVFIGITLIIFSSRVLYKTIGKAKLEIELNEKIDR